MHSAGTIPKGLDSQAVEVMGETEIDITNQRSKHVSELAGTLRSGAKEESLFVTVKFKRIHKGSDNPLPYQSQKRTAKR